MGALDTLYLLYSTWIVAYRLVITAEQRKGRP